MGLLPLAFFPLTMTPAILHSMLLMRVLHVLLSHVAACSWPGWLFGWKCAPGLSCLPRLVRLAGWLTGWLATSFSASALFRTSMHIYGPWLAAKAAASAIFECHHHVHGPGRWSRSFQVTHQKQFACHLLGREGWADRPTGMSRFLVGARMRWRLVYGNV